MINYTDPELVGSVKVTKQPSYGQTATGYGGKIPTRFTLRYGEGHMRHARVYAMCYGNGSSLYIVVKGEELFIDPATEQRLTSASD
jgi:hypothetical protein